MSTDGELYERDPEAWNAYWVNEEQFQGAEPTSNRTKRGRRLTAARRTHARG